MKGDVETRNRYDKEGGPYERDGADESLRSQKSSSQVTGKEIFRKREETGSRFSEEENATEA